ncbi:uncharacterized protein LOC119596215 [Penaeus monodon]|uniref:uncharacterized protein LOC119596215 n=1 Tax=Penaeus monodon TaxID=6687 RepID=UPI0018A72F32|nr:uncharacterized protein LOC119596215 [Penaeus monodon]
MEYLVWQWTCLHACCNIGMSNVVLVRTHVELFHSVLSVVYTVYQRRTQSFSCHVRKYVVLSVIYRPATADLKAYMCCPYVSVTMKRRELFTTILIFAIVNVFILGRRFIHFRVQETVTSQANSFAEWHQDVPRSTGLGAMDLQPENDPQLISYIRHVLMKRPSRGPYVLGHRGNLTFPFQEDQKLQEYLKKMAGGVFVEAYAGDGEKETSTLYLERNESWSGLLVEPDPALYASLLGKGRKSFSVNSNLSLSLTNFTSRSIDSVKEGNATLPLYTLVRATGMPEIDFLCLHTGGTELQILQTFPWINMRVRIINVEYSNVPGNVLAVQTFLKDKGFDLTIMQEHSATFVRKDLMDELMGTTQRPHARMTLVKIGKKGKTFFEIKRGT